MELELGKMYNVRDVVKEYMSCNSMFGDCYIWKRLDYLHPKKDDGLRFLLQPILNNMYRVKMIYNISDKNTRRHGEQ